MKWAQTIGVRVSDTTVDTTTAKVRVSENSRKKAPMMPPMKMSGTKAATSDRLIDTTVKPICFEPSSAARIGGTPRSMLRDTFSIITMASSTTKPTEMVMAIRLRLSRLKPATHMHATVPASDSGTATPAASVGVARRRKANTTPITSATVISSVTWMSSTAARIVTVRSVKIEMSTPAGTQRRSSGSSAFTRSTVSMTLALGCLVTMSSTEGRLLYQPAARRLLLPRSTVATSPSFTTVPAPAFTTMPAKSSGVDRRSEVASVSVRSGPSKEPMAWPTLALPMAVRIASIDRPMAARRCGSMRTRMAGWAAPLTVTSATPSTWEIFWAMTVSAAS